MTNDRFKSVTTDTLKHESKPIPFYLIKVAVENSKEHDEYVVVRSDNDYHYARTLDEANTLAAEMRSQIGVVAPTWHTVQIIELQEDPPDA